MRTYERLIDAFNGLWHAFRRDEGLLCLSLLLCVACSTDRSAIPLSLAAVAVELLNTAIEMLCDLLCPTHHPTIGQIKDVSAAASLMTQFSVLYVVAHGHFSPGSCKCS